MYIYKLHFKAAKLNKNYITNLIYTIFSSSNPSYKSLFSDFLLIKDIEEQ